MAFDTQANVSSLSGPFNPTGHYMTLQGQNNHSLTSKTALVYAQGGLPKPWPYVFISIMVSFVIGILGTVSAWTISKPKKPSVFSPLRKPLIKFNVYRTIMMVVNCAAISSTHTIPSSISTVSLAFSLITNFLDWDDQFDWHSWAVLVCTTVLLSLLPVQFVPNFQVFKGNGGVVSGAAGYGTVSLFGGTCLRILEKGEEECVLKDLPCTPGPIMGLAANKSVTGEAVALRFGLAIVPLCLAYMLCYTYRHVISAKGSTDKGPVMLATLGSADDGASMAETLEPADKGALMAVMKYGVTTMLLLMFIAVGLLAWDGGFTYVDVTKATDGTRIYDCFTGYAPRDPGDFLKLWFKQEWNDKTQAAKRVLTLANLFAWI